ncbi:MAG: hypothetical protein H0X25_21420 [Acidobacteriales bacterium]|nr:hypothetical protein [Terriglobales bacterium]
MSVCRRRSTTALAPDAYTETRSDRAVDVVVVNDFAHVNGGAAQVAISSAVGLAARGHRTWLFAAVPPISDSLRVNNLQVVLTEQCDIASDSHRLQAAARGLWNLKAAAAMRNLLSTWIHKIR